MNLQVMLLRQSRVNVQLSMIMLITSISFSSLVSFSNIECHRIFMKKNMFDNEFSLPLH